MIRLPSNLRPRTAGAWLALVAALLECPAEAFVVPLAWCPQGGVRAVVRRLHAHERGDDFRVTWHQIQQDPHERAVVDTAFAAVDACPELLDDGRALHVAIADAHDLAQYQIAVRANVQRRAEAVDLPWVHPTRAAEVRDAAA